MDKKERRIVVKLFGIATVLIMIAMFVLGVNLLKNRWHRLDFKIDSIEATQLSENDYKANYRVKVSGSAKTWFYDFNTYKFNLTYASSGDVEPLYTNDSQTVIVTHSGSNNFSFEFYLKDLEDFPKYIYKAANISVDGNPKEGTEIKLFLSEYADMLVEK